MIKEKTLLTVKTDKNLKQAAQKTAEGIGVPLGTIVNSFLKQFVRTKELNLSLSYRPSASLILSIREARREYYEDKLPKAVGINSLIKELGS